MMSIYQKNINAISKHYGNINLTSEVALNYVQSRDGKLYPKGWYSNYNPSAASEKMLLASNASTILCLGLGAGYQITPFVTSKAIKKIIIVESNLSLLANIIRVVDLSSIIESEKVVIYFGDDPTDALAFTTGHYQPILDGNLELIPLRFLLENNEPFYLQYQKKLQDYLLNLSSDLSGQAYFAKHWFRNIVINIDNFRQEKSLKKIKKAIIIGAGSSVDQNIDKIRASQTSGSSIIACDAALMLLSGYGISPNYVLTMDAQIFTHYHFIGMNDVTLVSDLSSSHFLANRYNAILFAGKHPLAQLTPFNRLPTDTGNIGSVAYAFARSLGATEILSFGLDFSYLAGRPYARGSYLYPFFHSLSNRLLPTEGELAKLVFKHPNLITTHRDDGFIDYQPQLFLFYQQQHQKSLMQAVNPWCQSLFNSHSFLKDYAHNLRQLSTSNLLSPSALAPYQKNILMTLMPLAAYYHKKKASQPLAESLDFSLNVLKDMGY